MVLLASDRVSHLIWSQLSDILLLISPELLVWLVVNANGSWPIFIISRRNVLVLLNKLAAFFFCRNDSNAGRFRRTAGQSKQHSANTQASCGILPAHAAQNKAGESIAPVPSQGGRTSSGRHSSQKRCQ